MKVREAGDEVRRPYEREELLVLLWYHPLMMSRVTHIDWDESRKYGRGELHAEFDITANYVRAMAQSNLASPCEQGVAFYLHRALKIPASARTHLICTGGVIYRGDLTIPDGMTSLGIWVEVERLDVNDRYADAYSKGRVGLSRAKPLVEVKNLVVRIEL